MGFDCTLNTDGSFDYVGRLQPRWLHSNAGPQKAGIGLQGLFLIGETGARVTTVTNNINSWWNGAAGGIGQTTGAATRVSSDTRTTTNKGCGYAMFNNFKGLKLQDIVTLPAVARPAGPGAQPAGDWYADYQDWLVANQTSPTTTAWRHAGARWASPAVAAGNSSRRRSPS